MKISVFVAVATCLSASVFAETEYRYLPVGYTQVEYIETDGDHKCVVKTDVIASDTLRAVMDYIPTEYTGDVNFGDSSNDNSDWRFFTYSGGPLFDCGIARAGSTSGNAIPLNERYTVEVGMNGEGKIFLDVTKHGEADKFKSFTASPSGTPSANNVCIFGGMANGGATYAKMRLYSLVISNSVEAVGDFVPCKLESDGTLGLYDLVSENFYPNASGSGTFIGGDVVEMPDPNMPRIASVSAAWKDGATELTVTLASGFGAASVVFTDAVSGEEYAVPLADNLDASEGEVMGTYTISTATLPAEKTYAWSVTVKNPDIELPATMVSKAKYYTGDADATVRYVSKSGSDESNGLLLSTAKATLQAAIDALGEDGGTVYIDDGDYAFTSDTDTAVVITTAVHVVGLSRDASKVTITRTGTPKRNFRLNHADCSLEFVTVSGGSAEGGDGASISLFAGTVTDCVICNMACYSWNCHGALFAKGSSRVARCIFRNNKGGGTGTVQGVALKTDGTVVVENCLFYGNENTGGNGNGGGTVSLGGNSRLINCTVAGNKGIASTGVYVSYWGGRPQVQNCAIYGNTADSDETEHGHVWYSESGAFFNCASEIAINDNCPARAPGFRDALNNDYTLSSASELIDAGLAYSETAATSETDLAGNAREVDGVDIGCYEYTKTDLDVGFTASVNAGLAPVEVTFVATVFGATGDITYDWDFDNDGTVDKTTTEGTVTHAYEHAGLYSITLKVTTESGATKSATLVDEVLVSPKTVYADSANGQGAAYPYDTPETATPDLALAIATAGEGSTVIVEDGSYAASEAAGFLVDKNIRILSRSQDPSKCIVKDLQDVEWYYERRVMDVNHRSAFVAGLTLEGGYQGRDLGATLRFGLLGGTVSNCVIRAGYVRDWGGDAALALVTASAVVTHSIFEEGLARDDYTSKNGRGKICSVSVSGQVDNCLIRNFNRGADNQNIVTVYNGGKLLNCTVVDGLCGFANNEEMTPCCGVRAESGARVENCAIVGFGHVEEDDSVTVRAWTGDANCFANCATDTAEPINETCVTVTTQDFRSYAAKDYRPKGRSPLVNGGLTNELADGTDFLGAPRKIGLRIDIGCYESATRGMILFIR